MVEHQKHLRIAKGKIKVYRKCVKEVWQDAQSSMRCYVGNR